MRLPVILQLLAGFSLSLAGESSVVDGKQTKTVFCFWDAVWHFPQFTSENIDPLLCSHLVYGYGELNNVTWNLELESTESTEEINLEAFHNMTQMKRTNPRLKSLYAVGHYSWVLDIKKNYLALVADPEKRQTFITSAVDFLVKHNFDGLLLHWGRVPQTDNEAKNRNKKNLSVFLKEIKTAFLKAKLTIALSIHYPLRTDIDENFELGLVYQHADTVLVHAYDYHGDWESYTGAVAPLFDRKSSDGNIQYSNVRFTWHHMKINGAIPAKTVLVVAFKGAAYTLEDETKTGMEAPAIKPKSWISPPNYTQACANNATRNWTLKWDDDQKVPYMFNGNKWVSYEDPRSVREKVMFANSKGLGGVAGYNLENDDYQGTCSKTPYPLLRAMYEAQGINIAGRVTLGSIVILVSVISIFL